MKTTINAAVVFSAIILLFGSAKGQWNQITSAMTSDNIVSLAVAPNGHVFAGTYSNGLYRSTNSGGSWTQVLGPSSVYEVLSLAIDSSGDIYAGTYAAGLYRSTNDGSNWTLLSSSSGSNTLPVDDIYSILILPSGTLLAADGSSYDGAIYRSTDGGSTWTDELNAAYITCLSTNAAFSPSTVYVYAGGTSSGGVFHYSTDDGATWTSGSGVNNLTALAAKSASAVFAGTGSKGIYLSSDNGTHWSVDTIGLSNDYINYNALAISASGVIYTGTQGGGVFYSTNDGADWHTENSGLTNKNICSFAFDSGGNVYAGSNGNGIWTTADIALAVEMVGYNAVYEDGGITVTWQTRSEVDVAGFNLLRKTASESKYSTIAGYGQDPSLCGLGTSSTGKGYTFTDGRILNGEVYDYEIEEVTTQGNKRVYGPISATASARPVEYSLEQNYPNPFNPATTIRYQLSSDSYVSLKVYDLLGRKIATLVNEIQNSGTYSVTFDGSNLPSGIYLYKLDATSTGKPALGHFSKTAKMINMK